VISRVWEATTAKRMQIDPYCIVDVGVHHSILPLRGGMTGQSAPAVLACCMVTLNDREGVRLLLAA